MIKKIKSKLRHWRRATKKYFHRPIIVYSKQYAPAVLVLDWQTKTGEKYARVKFTNKRIKAGYIGIVDIPAAQVTKVRKLASPFMHHIFKILPTKKNSYNASKQQ